MKRLSVLIATIAVLGVTLWVVLTNRNSGSDRSGSKAVATTAPTAPGAPAVAQDLPTLLESSVEDGDEHGEFTTTTDVYKQRLFKVDPELAQFDAFREQVLQDADSKAEYHKLLSDKSLMKRIQEDLLHPRYEKDTMETNVKRLMEIDYLREALSWKDNPARAELVSTVAGIITEDTFTSSMPRDVKRSLAATKMELFQILSGHDPALLADLIRTAKGSRLEAMMQYFADANQRRIDKERELSLQAQATKQ